MSVSFTRPLVVVYDKGSATPMELVRGLRDLGTVVFAVPDSAHTRQVKPMLDLLGEVLPLSGHLSADIDRLQALRPAAVLTFSERMLGTTARFTHALGLPGHSLATVQVLTDKHAQRQRFNEVGPPVRTSVLDGPEDWPAAVGEVGLPAVIKPACGEGSRNTYKVDDAETGARIVAEVFTNGGERRMVAEEFLVGVDVPRFGELVSVESVVSAGASTHLAVSGKYQLVPPFRERGQFWPAELTAQERNAILELATRAIDAIGVQTGVLHTEIKRTPTGPRLIEINGRMGGYMNEMARGAADFDLVTLAGRLALGQTPVVAPLEFPGVFYLHNSMAPTGRVRFVAVEGADYVRKLEGVVGYQVAVEVGAELPGGVSTVDLDVLRGRADDHDHFERLLDDALRHLVYVFELEDGTRLRLDGHALANGTGP
jgi:hypothetical protein